MRSIRCFLSLPAIAILALTFCGCERGSGSVTAGEATKTLLYFRQVGDQVSAYAPAHGGKFPDSLKDLPNLPKPPSGAIIYQGEGVHNRLPEPVIILYADPKHFRATGIPVLWSDGTAELLSEREFDRARQRATDR